MSKILTNLRSPPPPSAVGLSLCRRTSIISGNWHWITYVTYWWGRFSFKVYLEPEQLSKYSELASGGAYRAFCTGESGRVMKLSSHPHQVLRLRMSGTKPALPSVIMTPSDSCSVERNFVYIRGAHWVRWQSGQQDDSTAASKIICCWM
jgi:hypothetical protein